MSWKRQLQQLGFETDNKLEARCCKCGYTCYEQSVIFYHKSHLRMLYVDEFANNGTALVKLNLPNLTMKRQKVFKVV